MIFGGFVFGNNNFRNEVIKTTQIHAFKIDLTKIDGNGDFACPGCGIRISPEDENESVYSILGSNVNNYGLEEIILLCKRCSSHIHLTGFSLLQEIETTHYDARRSDVDQPWYVAHV